MSCTLTRIDHLDNNTTPQVNPAGPLYDSSRGKIYFVYANNSTATAFALENYAIYFREYDPVAGTFLAPVAIETPGTTLRCDRPELRRLDNGTLVCVYMMWNVASSGLYQTCARESTDNGATWGARTVIDNSGASRQFVDMASDGTHVSIFVIDEGNFGGSPPGHSIWYYARTAANTWATGPTLVYNGQALGGSSAQAIKQEEGEKQEVLVLDSGATILLMMHRFDSATTQRISCWRSTDSGATWTEIVVKSLGAEVMLHYPRMELGADDRIRAVWLENAATPYYPVIAYSDDHGATWTVVGSPAELQIADTTAWKPQNVGFMLGPDDQMYLSTWRQIAGIWTFYVYKGSTALTGWTLVASCDVGANVISNLLGATVRVGTTYYHIVDPVIAGPSHYSIAFLAEADVIDTGGGGPPLVEESPSGSDATNIVLRDRLSTQRGWSAHDWPFSCFAAWPEGDYTTQRRLPIKIAGVSIIDPSVSDPSALPAIFKFDDPEHYGRERFMYDENNTIVPRLDPFYRQAHTKAFAITNGVGVAIVRGVFVRYRRAGSPLTVQVFIDGVQVQTNTLPITGAAGGPDDVFPVKEVFLPLARLSNVGSFCQLRFEDESLDYFSIERVAIKKIDKKQRARNQGL